MTYGKHGEYRFHSPGRTEQVQGAGSGTYLIHGALQALYGSILGIVLGLGEEYGWRGYLQSELFKLGGCAACSCWV